MELSTREIATLFWFAITFLACVIYPKTRVPLLDLVRTFFQRQILLVVALLAFYVVLIVWALSSLSLWRFDQLKNTLVWSLAVAFASLFRIPGIAGNPPFFRDWIKDNLKVIVFVEFLLNAYALPLLAELALLPVIALVVAMVAIGEREERYAPTVKLLNAVLALTGVGLFVYAAYVAIVDFQHFASVQTLRDFYTPIFLSLLLLPFIFVMHVYMSYETALVRINLSIPDRRLRPFAKLRAIVAFGPSVALLRKWTRNLAAHRPHDKNAIRQSIKEVKAGRRREKNPPCVPPERGWSPTVAKGYLTDQGLIAGDYHRSFDEWFASTPYLELGDGLMPDNLAYYVEGDELVATRLKLVLNVNSPADPHASETRFREVAQLLLDRSIPGHGIVLGTDGLGRELQHWRVRVEKNSWEGGIAGGYDKRLIINICGAGA